MTPQCIGIIMDGNRRWAKKQGLPAYAGHTNGYKKLKEVLSWTEAAGVRNLIVYAFSTENWNRSAEEVSYLMDIFRHALKDDLEEISGKHIQVRFFGTRERFSADMQKMMDGVEEKTKNNGGFTLGIALSYGGRAEILSAAKKMCAEKAGESATEKDFETYLWSAGMPDPDIIIRPGGEKRLSGFLTWQSVYSELFFTDTLWPDFSKEEFDSVLNEFAARERRRGK